MARGRPPGPEKVPFPLRIDKKLLDAVRRLAAAELRSANSQIELLIREAITKRGLLGDRLDTRPEDDGTQK